MAEKMLTNWFTFLLYKFLKVSRGGRKQVSEAIEQWEGKMERGGDQWEVLENDSRWGLGRVLAQA